MSLRRLWTWAPHTPRAATSRSWSTADLFQPTHARVQTPYRGKNFIIERKNASSRPVSQKHGKHQHPSRVYSNYAPRDPSQGYGAYGQPPKSRASRLKDMAIGSALTIAVYLAYIFYCSRQMLVLQDMERNFTKEELEIVLHYEKILRKAEAEDDGSPESAEKIRRIFKERTIAILYMAKEDKDDTIIDEFGPLLRFPEGHKEHGSERVKGEDILVLMPPIPSEEEMADIKPEDKVMGIDYLVIVAVNDFEENLGIDDGNIVISHQTHPKLNEIWCRLVIMIDNLYQKGTLDPDKPTIITFFLRDGMPSFIYRAESHTSTSSEAGSDGLPDIDK
ncbi:hypothetical protein F5B21DRAFT_491574 [Xylaria acuta]|nr:hypothetical protein F5B21DRAFT_491574 [Xylaria acuta]